MNFFYHLIVGFGKPSQSTSSVTLCPTCAILSFNVELNFNGDDT